MQKLATNNPTIHLKDNQVALIPGTKDFQYPQIKLTNVIHHINKLKNISHVTFFFDLLLFFFNLHIVF